MSRAEYDSQLVDLIERRASREIEVGVFCREFYKIYSFYAELEAASGETQVFAGVYRVAAIYSPYEEDHSAYPEHFSTEDAVDRVVDDAWRMLMPKP